MRSFQSHDKSNVAFKFIFTGLAALTLLFVICVVFSVWYFIRYEMTTDENLRKAQSILAHLLVSKCHIINM
jgi:hypothetical protein